MPSAGHLARMMDEYIASRNMEDLGQLRQEIMRGSAQPDLWVTAQMRFYLGKRRYIVVLRQFMQYYTFIGIPKELVLPYIQEGSLLIHGKVDGIHPLLGFSMGVPRVGF